MGNKNRLSETQQSSVTWQLRLTISTQETWSMAEWCMHMHEQYIDTHYGLAIKEHTNIDFCHFSIRHRCDKSWMSLVWWCGQRMHLHFIDVTPTGRRYQDDATRDQLTSPLLNCIIWRSNKVMPAHLAGYVGTSFDQDFLSSTGRRVNQTCHQSNTLESPG